MNQRPEATPPVNLPTEELSLVEDQGSRTEIRYRADSTIGDDPVGDAIAEEIKRVELLTKPLEDVPQPPIHDGARSSWNATQVAKGLQSEISETERWSTKNLATLNTFKSDYERRIGVRPTARVVDITGSIADKVGDKLVEGGGQIEGGEENQVRKASEKVEKEKDISEKTVARRAVAVALWEDSQKKIAADRIPTSLSKEQQVARIYEDGIRAPNDERKTMRPSVSERDVEDERALSLEVQEDQESIALLAREIQLQEEDLKIQEDELHLRRRKLLLLQRKKTFEELKKKGGRPTSSSGWGGVIRPAV